MKERTAGGVRLSEDKLSVAKRYVDKQLATMRKYGSAPKEMSGEQYWALVEKIVNVLAESSGAA